MPKSRGRKHHSRPRRTGPTPSTWQSTILRAGKALAAPDAARLDAELYASGVVGTVWAGRPLGDREILDVWLEELLSYAGRRPTAEGAAVVAALRLVLPHPALDAALEDWAGALTAALPWAQEPTPLPRAASRSGDAWDDTQTWFLEYDDAIVLAHTARVEGGAVADAAVLPPGSLTSWDEEVARSEGEVRPRESVAIEQAVATLLSAQRLTEMTYPPYDDDGYLMCGHLLAARLAAVGTQPNKTDWEPLPDEARAELVEAFLSELELELDDDEAVREIADLCLLFGDGYLGDDPLAWSPGIIERFLLDWVPRKTFLEPDVQRLVPTVTYAFAGWAMLRRGVDRRWAGEAAQVALALADDFAQLYDETEKGPATQLVQRLQQAGIDLHDKAAVDREVAAYNAELLARRALGRE